MPKKKRTFWENYEKVAAYLLNRFSKEFNLKRVEGKQKIQGLKTGVKWEIDAKGLLDGSGGGFMIVEVRRYLNSKQKMEQVGGLAYRIIDTGADGGIVVSKLGFQKGAKKIAEANNIIEVKLYENSTPEEFAMQFFNQFHVGVKQELNLAGEATCVKSTNNPTEK